MTSPVFSNKGINDVIKIVKPLEDAGLLIKGVSETIENEPNEQNYGLLGMLLGTLGASSLGNLAKLTYLSEEQCKHMTVKLEQARIFHATLFFN